MADMLMILVPCVAIPVALALILTIICMCRRKKDTNGQHKALHKASVNNQLEMNAMLAKQPLRSREFPMANIRFLQELGEGAFGKVYKGELLGYYNKTSVCKVAVKTLKENAAPKMQQDFRREVDLMTDLQHPNVVCLLGVCMKEEPMCMLFEYMSHGDLHQHLIMHSPHSDVSVSDDEGNSHILDHSDMLYIATQVAAGMEYLAGHHYIHRDLAARNILIGDNLTVKISDFGLSRDVYSSDYYRVQGKSLLPVRWMPPESILYGKFTTESDVWSFGVVLWEIYSYGLQPYYGYSNQEVIEMIRARQILPCPDDCPSRLYSLMVECWHEMPVRRPSFKEIHLRLRQWKNEMLSNPHLFSNVNATHSHSGHSSSTHNSGHSGGQMSHHSSTGPSNNTASTGLTGNSHQVLHSGMGQPNGMVPMCPPNGMMPGHKPGHASPLNYGHMIRPPMMMQGHLVGMPVNIPPPPMPPNLPYHQPTYNRPAQFTSPAQFTNPGLYKKPSPPGSVASHKSSSLHSSASPASSVSNQKPHGIPNIPNNNMGRNPINSPTQQHNITNLNMNNYNKMSPGSLPSSNHNSYDLYIPEAKTAEI